MESKYNILASYRGISHIHKHKMSGYILNKYTQETSVCDTKFWKL